MIRHKIIPTYPDRVFDLDEHAALEGEPIDGIVLTARSLLNGRELVAHAIIKAQVLINQDPAKLRHQAELDLDIELRRMALHR